MCLERLARNRRKRAYACLFIPSSINPMVLSQVFVWIGSYGGGSYLLATRLTRVGWCHVWVKWCPRSKAVLFLQQLQIHHLVVPAFA